MVLNLFGVWVEHISLKLRVKPDMNSLLEICVVVYYYYYYLLDFSILGFLASRHGSSKS